MIFLLGWLVLLQAGASAASLFAVATVGATAFMALLTDRDTEDAVAGRDDEPQGVRPQGVQPQLDHLPLVTWIVRAADAAVLYVSPEVERLLGVTPDEAREEDDFWLDRLHPLDRDAVLESWRAWTAGRNTEPFRCDYRLLAADDRVVWVQDVTVLVQSDAGGSPRFQRHLLDITRQRQLEEQLLQAQRLELLGHLAGGVAHDFNNLLAVIAGYCDRLGSQLPATKRYESVAAIGAAAQRGSSLVRQLLTFSRPQPVELGLVDLNSLVREFAPMLRRVIGEDVELEVLLERGRLPVEAHPVQIDQILMNLVVNARDAMPYGGRLTITTGTAGTGDGGDGLDGDAAVIIVSDTGCGMDAATQARIFEPFFSTKEPGKGSGLGLATASGIVRQAGGSIAVSSVPGAGTTFTIRLPLAAGPGGSESDAFVARAPAPRGRRETVLVVEDEPALRELEEVMLGEAGYHVLASANAAEALVTAAHNRIDALVVDVVMPGMSGPQLVDELAARGLEIPTVFVSGYGSDEISSRGLVGTAATAVIEKPFQSDVLLAKVRELLDETAARQSQPRLDALQPRSSSNGRPSRTVRCLSCGAPYELPLRHDLLASDGCPCCSYLGWTNAD